MDPRDASASKKQGFSDGGRSVEQFKHKHKGNKKNKKKLLASVLMVVSNSSCCFKVGFPLAVKVKLGLAS